MHRHAYTGRKLQLAAGPRRALVRGQLTSLTLHEAITTTLPKAKEVAPQFERLVTYAKKGTLAGGRSLRRQLLTENSVQKCSSSSCLPLKAARVVTLASSSSKTAWATTLLWPVSS